MRLPLREFERTYAMGLADRGSAQFPAEHARPAADETWVLGAVPRRRQSEVRAALMLARPMPQCAASLEDRRRAHGPIMVRGPRSRRRSGHGRSLWFARAPHHDGAGFFEWLILFSR